MATKLTKEEKIALEIKALGFQAFITSDSQGDDRVMVSTEYGDDAADYWGEYRGGDPYINPKLIDLATKHKCYWEWRDPSAIILYPL